MLLAALARPERIKALVLLAPHAGLHRETDVAYLVDSQKRSILEDGFWTRPSPYDAAGYPITRELIQEGRQWSCWMGEIALGIPVRILQGGLDTDVPWTHSLDLADAFQVERRCLVTDQGRRSQAVATAGYRAHGRDRSCERRSGRRNALGLKAIQQAFAIG